MMANRIIDDIVKMPAYQSVRYNGKDNARFLVGLEYISDATDSMNQCRVKLLVDLVTQA